MCKLVATNLFSTNLFRASREEMITRAQSDQQMNQEMKVNLMSEQTRAAEAGDLHQI